MSDSWNMPFIFSTVHPSISTSRFQTLHILAHLGRHFLRTGDGGVASLPRAKVEGLAQGIFEARDGGLIFLQRKDPDYLEGDKDPVHRGKESCRPAGGNDQDVEGVPDLHSPLYRQIPQDVQYRAGFSRRLLRRIFTSLLKLFIMQAETMILADH
jgi:hypothetical protein